MANYIPRRTAADRRQNGVSDSRASICTGRSRARVGLTWKSRSDKTVLRSGLDLSRFVLEPGRRLVAKSAQPRRVRSIPGDVFCGMRLRNLLLRHHAGTDARAELYPFHRLHTASTPQNRPPTSAVQLRAPNFQRQVHQYNVNVERQLRGTFCSPPATRVRPAAICW